MRGTAYALMASAAVAVIVATELVHPTPRLIWNASASVPVGLYAATPVCSAKVGDLVAVTPPAGLAAYLAVRQYLPRGVPLLKPVAAITGQRVCRNGLRISIDGRRVGVALDRDRRGRALPAWLGCRRLGAGQIFLMNPASSDSFDGRYFGPLPRATLRARLRPLWVYPMSVAAARNAGQR